MQRLDSLWLKWELHERAAPKVPGGGDALLPRSMCSWHLKDDRWWVLVGVAVGQPSISRAKGTCRRYCNFGFMSMYGMAASNACLLCGQCDAQVVRMPERERERERERSFM